MGDEENMGIGNGDQPPLETSLAEDEKALRKGNMGPLIIGLLAAVAVAAGLGFVLLQGDDGDQYGTIGRAINGMKQEHFDQFWACALPNQQLSELRSDQDLRSAIHQRARRVPRAYATHMREQCLVKLSEHGPRLRELIAPEDLHEQISALQTSITDLSAGWTEYIAYLEGATEGYSEGDAAPTISKIAKGWYDYRVAHGDLNSSIRDHLEGR